MLDDRMGCKITPSRRILAKTETKGETMQHHNTQLYVYMLPFLFPNFIFPPAPLSLSLSLSAGCLYVTPTTSSCRERSSSWRRPTGESSQRPTSAATLDYFPSVIDLFIILNAAWPTFYFIRIWVIHAASSGKLRLFTVRKANIQIINHGFMCAHIDSIGSIIKKTKKKKNKNTAI